MAANSSLPTLAQACQGPLVWRVQSATRILQEGSSKEAGTVLRTLVHSVFGAAGPAEPGMLGWGLQHFTKTQHPAEFQLLCEFLSARGPLLGMALRHAHDTFMLFEFPIASLPAVAQAAILEGRAGPLYANKVPNPGPGKAPTSVLLNSFEFYMFHFCYYLLHVGVADGCGVLTWTGVGDAVYPTLLEDYLTTFLPCHDAAPAHAPSAVPPAAPHTPFAARLTGLQHLTQFMSPISTPQAGGTLQGHPLFGGATSPHTSSPFPNSQLPQRPAAWVSQTVVQVLVEMWVNQCGAAPGRPSSPLSPSAPHRSPLPPGSPTQPQMPSWAECAAPVQYRPHWFVPPTLFGIGASVMCEHIRAVRMVIKHLHYFSNSVKPAQASPLDNLRRSVWPMCRRSFYTLFMQLLQRWPLDSSFRLLLEAWLSYIQPWRYTNINKPADPSESGVPVEWQWQRFMADNLLFYSSVLTAVMPRLLRLDLSAPKNAHMLYRICKVFSLPNFGTILKATEDALLTHPHALLSPTSPHRMQNVQQGQQGQLPPQAVAVAVRSHILEMENNNHFVYTSIFGRQTQNLARQVLRSVRAAEAAVTGELAAMDQPPAPGRKVGMLGGMWEWLVTATTSAASDDNTADELRRSLLHLQAAADHLQLLFQISEDMQPSFASDSSPCKNKSAVPDQVSTDNGLVLSDQGRRQLVCGLRRRDLKYEGDPDLRPISCGELAVLVRWLYALACHLNAQYGAELRSGYYRGGVQGVLWRCVLQPPLTVYEYRRQMASSDPCGALYPVKVARVLPPRLSFRRLASRQLLVSVLAIALILSVVFGMSLPSQLTCVVFPALLLYFTAQVVVGRALLQPQHPLHGTDEDCN